MKIGYKRLKVAFLAGLVALGMQVEAIEGEPRKPLLMPGKQALFQRVLAKPGTMIYPKPGELKRGSEVQPFSIYYAYERRKIKDQEWVHVGFDRIGALSGWIANTDLIPWNQGLTVAFRDPLANDRALLFRDRDGLKTLVESYNLSAYDNLYQSAVRGDLPDDSPVLAIQPKAHVDILEDFYLVPIRQHEDVYLGNEQARMLQVSSVPLVESRQTQPVQPKSYRSGIVFVIDSTLSMDPYIDRTREAVRKIYDTIAKANVQGDVNFGLVAFRDNTTVAPGLEYLSRTYASLEDGRDPERFFQRVDRVQAATVSSRNFVEDAYAGVKKAIEEMDWKGHDGRYLVLITDAGARKAGDSRASTGMNADALRQLAQDKGVAIFVLHLLTPQGKGNHPSAERQYRRLSHYPGIGSFYYGVEMGEVGAFGTVLDTLAQQITAQVQDAARGVTPLWVDNTRQTEQKENRQLAEFQSKVAKLGYALRMKYLQKHEGGQVPQLFDAWLIDRDFRQPNRRVLDIRVLLTRDQLSDLHFVMRQVLEYAEEGLLSPRNFFNDIKSLAATVARDPKAMGASTRATGSQEANLADLGFMREYIEDLPYSGEIMNLSLADWENWPAKRQLEFIHGLEEKINYYQVLHDHTDLWISLDGGSVTGDSVFPVALEMLP